MERNDLRESSEEDAALNELPRTDIYIYVCMCFMESKYIIVSNIRSSPSSHCRRQLLCLDRFTGSREQRN